MPAVYYKTHLMVWSTDADDVKMVRNIPFPLNYVIIDQLALNLVHIFLNNTDIM